MYRVYWDKAAEPINNTVPRILYDLRRDEEEDLLMDAIREDDIYHEYGSKLEFDALITPYIRVERKMMIMRRFLNRAGNELKVREDAPDAPGLEITKPFKRNGSVQVAAIFYLTDGQTVTIMFHNPDTTPNKLAPNDVLVSWKWMINKKDVTIVVAPEQGKDLDVNEVGSRIMKLAEKNSKAFQRANVKRAERLANLQANDQKIAELDRQLNTLTSDLNNAKAERDDAIAKYQEAKQKHDNDAIQAKTKKEAWELKPLNTISDIGKFMNEEDDWYSEFSPQGTKIREAMKSLGWTDFKGVNEEGIEFEHRLLPDGRYSNEFLGSGDKPNFPVTVLNLVQAYENGSLTKIGDSDKKPDESKIVNPDEWEAEMLRREEEALAKEKAKAKTTPSADPQWDADKAYLEKIIAGIPNMGKDKTIAKELAPIFNRVKASGDAARKDLASKAMKAYQAAVIAASREAMSKFS